MNTIIRLRLIPETELRGKEILTIQPPATLFFWDHGNTSYLCGRCKILLAEDVSRLEMSGKVFKCNKCGSYNTV